MIYIFFTHCISPQPISGLWFWGRYWCIGLIQGVICKKQQPIIIYFLHYIFWFQSKFPTISTLSTLISFNFNRLIPSEHVTNCIIFHNNKKHHLHDLPHCVTKLGNKCKFDCITGFIKNPESVKRKTKFELKPIRNNIINCENFDMLLFRV